jgi:hypothetical protein
LAENSRSLTLLCTDAWFQICSRQFQPLGKLHALIYTQAQAPEVSCASTRR